MAPPFLGTNAWCSCETLGWAVPLTDIGYTFRVTRVAGQPGKVQTSLSNDVTLSDCFVSSLFFRYVFPLANLIQFPAKSSNVPFGRWAGGSRPSMALSQQKY